MSIVIIILCCYQGRVGRINNLINQFPQQLPRLASLSVQAAIRYNMSCKSYGTTSINKKKKQLSKNGMNKLPQNKIKRVEKSHPKNKKICTHPFGLKGQHHRQMLPLQLTKKIERWDCQLLIYLQIRNLNKFDDQIFRVILGPQLIPHLFL